MKAQMYIDLVGAFLVLMLVAATGFSASQEFVGERVQNRVECSLKNSAHSYADWMVKEGGSVARENADGSGFYLGHEVEFGRVKGAAGEFSVSAIYADGREVVLKERIGSGGSVYCVRRIVLCEGKTCAIKVCKNDDA